MSENRSGYTDDVDNWAALKWRGAVTSAIRGRRGQAFLREMLEALDKLPSRRLINREMESVEGEVCALGALGRQRGLDLVTLDPRDSREVAATFNVALALACEIMYVNDEDVGYWREETPEARWQRVRNWIAGQIM
jgi:hypothetical protein